MADQSASIPSLGGSVRISKQQNLAIKCETKILLSNGIRTGKSVGLFPKRDIKVSKLKPIIYYMRKSKPIIY